MRKMYKNVMIIANNIIFMNYGLYILQYILNDVKSINM